MVKAAVISLGVLLIGDDATALAQVVGKGSAFTEPDAGTTAPPPLAHTDSFSHAGADPGNDRSEFHFVLSFPLGVMNGFASHPGGVGGVFDLAGYSAYTSTIYGLGVSVGLLYEAQWFGVGAQVSGFLGLAGVSAFGDVYGLAYLSSGSVSPFVGAGVGLLANTVFFVCCPPPQQPRGGGGMTEGQLGVELGRLSPDHVRVQVSFEVLIPLYNDDDGSDPVGLLLNTRVAF